MIQVRNINVHKFNPEMLTLANQIVNHWLDKIRVRHIQTWFLFIVAVGKSNCDDMYCSNHHQDLGS